MQATETGQVHIKEEPKEECSAAYLHSGPATSKSEDAEQLHWYEEHLGGRDQSPRRDQMIDHGEPGSGAQALRTDKAPTEKALYEKSSRLVQDGAAARNLSSHELAWPVITKAPIRQGLLPDNPRKRSSPLDIDPGAKRQCVMSESLCLHCFRPGHTWGQCRSPCHVCRGWHPCRRCTEIDLESYVGPLRGFQVIQQSASDCADPMETETVAPGTEAHNNTMEGVNPQRLAMIAATAEHDTTPVVASFFSVGTKANMVPLGRPRINALDSPMDASPAPLISKARAHSATPSAALPPHPALSPSEASVPRDEGFDPRDEQTWCALSEYIHSAVQSSVDDDKTHNHGSDQAKVMKKIKCALRFLKPLILRDRKSVPLQDVKDGHLCGHSGLEEKVSHGG